VRAVKERYEARGLRVVSVHEWDERAAVEAEAREHGITWPTYLDRDQAFLESLGESSVPRFFVIDRRGRLRTVIRGSVEPGKPAAADLDRAVRAAIGQS
jgi:hypothetical protein